ncbi:MAG: hypothetical protein U0528_06285 [Anaerolineae bacterium]
MTQCPMCRAWSDHEDWYHDDDDISVEEFLANPERIRQPIVIPVEATPDVEPVGG